MEVFGIKVTALVLQNLMNSKSKMMEEVPNNA